jgi:hypothetical protein
MILGYLIPALVIVAPAIVPLVIFPGLGTRILSLASSGGGMLSGSTFLSGVLSSIPVLGYLALEIFDDYALVIMIMLSVPYFYYAIKSKNPVYFVPILWFISLLIAAPFDTSAWRFSYEAVVPLTLMASFGLYTILQGSTNQSKGKSPMSRRTRSDSRGSILPRAFLFVVLLGGIVIGSWGTTIASDALSQTNLVSQSQHTVYNAINWLGANTSNNSQYLSLSDWRFTYTNVILNRITFYQYERLPSEAIKVARNESAGYIIVTNITTLALPPASAFYPWNNFPSSSNSNLTLIFQNQDVRVFRIVSNST